MSEEIHYNHHRAKPSLVMAIAVMAVIAGIGVGFRMASYLSINGSNFSE